MPLCGVVEDGYDIDHGLIAVETVDRDCTAHQTSDTLCKSLDVTYFNEVGYELIERMNCSLVAKCPAHPASSRFLQQLQALVGGRFWPLRRCKG